MGFRPNQNKRFSQGNGGACVHGSIPLLVFLAKQSDDKIGFFHQKTCPQIIDLGSGCILQDRIRLFPEDIFTDIIGAFMIFHRADEF
ncbi:Uncharacterised protein [Chlamydia trachomatis]|nr:Uncharacterised protein [Chlamydia trachomatis]